MDALMLLHEGDLREELVQAAQEQDVSLIVLGRPADGESVFQLAVLEAFAAWMEKETGVETRIV